MFAAALSLVILPSFREVKAEMDLEHRQLLVSLAKDIKQIKYEMQDLSDENEEILSILNHEEHLTTEGDEHHDDHDNDHETQEEHE